MWRKNTRCTPICAIASTIMATGMLGCHTRSVPATKNDVAVSRIARPRPTIAEHANTDAAALFIRPAAAAPLWQRRARQLNKRRLPGSLPAKVDRNRNIKPENPFPHKPKFGDATAEQVHGSAHRDKIVTAIISLVIPKVCAIALMLRIRDRWPRDQIHRSAAGAENRSPSSLRSSSQLDNGGLQFPLAKYESSATVFSDHLADEDALAERLAPFDIVCLIRERTALPRDLMGRLPKLKLIASTGAINAAVDVAAAKEHGIEIVQIRRMAAG